jgi:hypothetical protein
MEGESMVNEAKIRAMAARTVAGSSWRIMLDEIDRLRAIVGCDDTCEGCNGECDVKDNPTDSEIAFYKEHAPKSANEFI